MDLFEQKFKKYLTEGDQFGYPDTEDEDAFLGWDANNYLVRQYFPEVSQFFSEIDDELRNDKTSGGEYDYKDLMTISNIRNILGDEIADDFKDFAARLTKINSDYYGLAGSYTNYDFSGLELITDREFDQQEKEELIQDLSSMFGEEIPTDTVFDDVRLSLSHTYEDGEFKPYLLVGLMDNDSGDEYPLYIDSTEESYSSDFSEAIDNLRSIGAID